MLDEIKVEFSDFTKIYFKDNKCLVASVSTGDCIFISKEIVDIFKRGESERFTFRELFDCVEDLDSRNLLRNMAEKLDNLNMWKYNEENITALRQNKISLDITNDCNLRCTHCCVSAGENGRGRELTTEELFTVIERIMYFNPGEISISGGEPMFRKDFVAITDKIRSLYSGNLTLMTNGTLIKDDETAAYLANNYDSFNLSLDGYDDESCSAIRGKGVFCAVIKSIKLLQKYTQKVSLSMVRTSDNSSSTDKFKALCESFNVYPVIRVFESVGRGEKLYKDLTLDRENDEKSIDWKRVEENFICNKFYNHKPQIFACQGALSEFQIDQKGDVYPCPLFMENEFKLFNILEVSDPKDYILSRRYVTSEGFKNFSKYMPYNIPKCKDCNKQLMCFSCAAGIRHHLYNNTLDKNCIENSNYFDLYWRDYEFV